MEALQTSVKTVKQIYNLQDFLCKAVTERLDVQEW